MSPEQDIIGKLGVASSLDDLGLSGLQKCPSGPSNPPTGRNIQGRATRSTNLFETETDPSASGRGRPQSAW